MQPSMEQPKFKFLLSTLSLDELPRPGGLSEYILTGTKPDGVDLTPLRQYGSRNPVRPERRLPIISIMFTGKLVSLSFHGSNKGEAAATTAEMA